MPKEMLLEKANQLREIADSLEGYAGEMEGEESSEYGEMGEEPMAKESYSKGGKGSKVKMALLSMKKGFGK